ncbi:UNVERIFIED_CONTAM: hypothetical protein GTU68_020927 [Idotea baltica]|nr:hypothetical protein [Idotea baltica]
MRYRYVCMFGFHHNFSDGTTNMKFCDIFLSLLNDVLQNKILDLSEVGRFAHPIQDDLANSISSYFYLTRLFLTRIYNFFICYGSYVSNFLKHYPMLPGKNVCTMVLENELNEFATQCLLKRCRMEGVTLNTAFTAAANIGMYRMILQKDASILETSFDSQQIINMRRYWPKEKQKDSFGCHIFPTYIHVTTKKEDIAEFWEYARKVHKIMYKELDVDKNSIKSHPLSHKLCLALFINFCASKLKLTTTNESHYCITNMGNVSSKFSGDGKVVSASKVLRSVSCHLMPTLCQHTLQTFKGKLYYSLDYYPFKMSEDTARTYASSLMDTLRNAIHLPN